MRLLDLFSGAGGAAVGYHRAGFDEIIGVDIEPQPNYPFTFVQADAFDVLATWDLSEFDMIHASPPCQRWSASTRDPEKHPDLIAPTRQALIALGVPYVIENVERAPLIGYLRLCGSMFGLQVRRHRYFELSFPAMSPACNHREWTAGRPWSVIGHLSNKDQKHQHSFKPSFEQGRRLMEMPWAKTVHELVEAIPPAYTEFIGEQFKASRTAIRGDAGAGTGTSPRLATRPGIRGPLSNGRR
jgi:DNA (cytosine-5)-methyltransferase 1